MVHDPVVLVSPARTFLLDAVAAAGVTPIVEPTGAVDAVIWSDPSDVAGLRTLLDEHPEVQWVQLPFAGVEPFVDALDGDRWWTCGKGVYADPCAEHALALSLAGLRGVGQYARQHEWSPPVGRNLYGANVVVVGGGGIAESFVALLAPFSCKIIVVRRTSAPFVGATHTVGVDGLDHALAGADLVVLCLALTPETTGLFDAARLANMQSHAWLVNVARGRHVVTDAVVAALQAETIGGYATDVTDPEPLPRGHPLWTLPNAIVTPHTANTPEMGRALLSTRVTENVRRFVDDTPLIGPVDVEAGY